jgi:hypothetical protein
VSPRVDLGPERGRGYRPQGYLEPPEPGAGDLPRVDALIETIGLVVAGPDSHLWPKAEDRTRTAAEAKMKAATVESCGLCADIRRFLSVNQR